VADRILLVDDEPALLDTLAEAYHVNGRHEEALKAIEQALAKNPANPDYYARQKTKLEEALRKGRP